MKDVRWPKEEGGKKNIQSSILPLLQITPKPQQQ